MTSCSGRSCEMREGPRRPAAFFDRDGVINTDRGYLHAIADFELVQGAAEAIRLCNQAGFLVFIVTNQGGIGLGLYDDAAVETLHAHMRELLAESGAHIDDIRFCPHHPEAMEARHRVACDWRKPGPGMLLDLIRCWPVDAAHSFLVGDRDRDVDAARAAGVHGELFSGGDLLPLVRRLVTDSIVAHLRDWLKDTALPLWCSAGLDPRGGFAERLDADAKPDPTAAQRVMAQVRQVYVYAHAAMLGLAPDGLTPARAAFDRALLLAALPNGGFAFALTPDGAIADPTRDTYSHAFLLLAASWLVRAGQKDVLPQLERIAAAIETLRHPGGGYVESDRPGALRRQNPHMHLLEAFLAAHAATGEAKYLDRATEIVSLFRAHFFDAASGALREYFDQDLRPAPGDKGDIVEGGHHYEWVWLLGEHARAAATPLPQEARALYRFAAAHCHDPKTGLIYHESDIHGGIRHAGKRAWPLTEAIKAAVALAGAGAPLDTQADRCLAALFRHFLDRPQPGLWLDTLTAQDEPAVTVSAASNFYHVFLAFAEYIGHSQKA